MVHQTLMHKFLKEIYGVGILFFYYVKYIILFGWLFLRYGLEYKDNMIMNVLWVFCFLLFIKDMVYKYVFNKSYCDENSCSSKR